METQILQNGMRVVVEHCDSPVVYCGIAVDAGTRDELPEESGMAHFTEHLSFKGTRHRSPRQVINCLESVGGDMNAFTGKEETVYYCTILRKHLNRALKLLMDIVTDSTYAQTEMDKEVEVVIDEIESYNDSPSELIFDEFEALLFEGHPLGRNILGDADCLRRLRSEDVHRFVERMYLPERMVLFVYGNVRLVDVLKVIADGPSVGSPVDLPTPRYPVSGGSVGQTFIREKDTHQAHVMIGCRAYGGNDPRHLHLYLLNNILGGPCMSSRLNLALRERYGLVYTVESNMTCYVDTGVWSIYFGCDDDDVDRCRRLVARELKRLTDAPLSARALKAAKRQLKGQIGISWENGENVAIGMGKRLLHYNRTQTMQQLCDAVDALTAEELWSTAKELFLPGNLTTLVYK